MNIYVILYYILYAYVYVYLMQNAFSVAKDVANKSNVES